MEIPSIFTSIVRRSKLLSILCLSPLFAFSCSEEEVIPEINVLDGSRVVSNITSSVTTLEFDCNTTWSITDTDGAFSISKQSGRGGSHTITITSATANCTNDTVTHSLTITAVADQRTTEKKLTYKIPPLFQLEYDTYEVSASGGTMEIFFNTEINLDDVQIYYDSIFETMVSTRATSGAHQGFDYYGSLPIKPNTSSSSRTGMFCLVEGSRLEDRHSIIGYVYQDSNSSSSSTDYSHDGEVVRLQTHSKGQGIPIVLMGDGFVDTDIADNTYDQVMRNAAETLFDIEPMTSLRDYFDLWYVTAVSATNNFNGSGKTVFKSTYTSSQSSEITGDDNTCTNYALKTGLTSKQLENSILLVILNSGRYGGTCSIYYSEPKNNCPTGISVAYVPMIDEAIYGVEMSEVLHHEVVGHGLGKLFEEYGSQKEYLSNGNITDDSKSLNELKNAQSKYLIFRNVSIESDPTKTSWSTFYADSRYAAEGLGAYEGAGGYPYGLYRPTDNSLMNTGTELNVYGRYLVYLRVMNIANNFEWTDDYETFVTFDQNCQKQAQPRQAEMRNGGNAIALPPHARPIVRAGNPWTTPAR